MGQWSTEDIDSLQGKTIVITEGVNFLGLESAKVLASAGAQVIITTDDPEKFQFEDLSQNITIEKLDLGSVASINSFCDRVMQEHSTIDILIHSADYIPGKEREETRDGHEKAFGVNYLGNFILTSQLFPMIMRSSDPRIVFLGSLEHHKAKLDFSDIDQHCKYDPLSAYGQSKLAMLIFAMELHRRCLVMGVKIRSVPVHPGLQGLKKSFLRAIIGKSRSGILPMVFAATSIEARSGVLYGPDGFAELWGTPRESKIPLSAMNMLAAQRLWNESERMSGLRFNVESSRSIGLH